LQKKLEIKKTLEVMVVSKWVLLSVTTLLCVTVWSFVFLSVFSENKYVGNLEIEMLSEVEEQTMETTVSAGKSEKLIVDFKQIGISKEVAIQIAPNGEISIDELLSLVQK
jgi:capsular polysaccharide biosynthesis protein